MLTSFQAAPQPEREGQDDQGEQCSGKAPTSVSPIPIGCAPASRLVSKTDRVGFDTLATCQLYVDAEAVGNRDTSSLLCPSPIMSP